MSNSKEKIWADGFSLKKKDNRPDWILGQLSIKVDDAVEWLTKHANERGWVNIDVAERKDGDGWSMKLDDWKPDPSKANKPKEVVVEEEPSEGLPF